MSLWDDDAVEVVVFKGNFFIQHKDGLEWWGVEPHQGDKLSERDKRRRTGVTDQSI